jgi:hypothetical protein
MATLTRPGPGGVMLRRLLPTTLVATVVQVQRAGFPRLRVFGEIVGLLWPSVTALRLERLWCDLLEQYRVPLLCGYRLEAGVSTRERRLADQIMQCHTRLPPPSEGFAPTGKPRGTVARRGGRAAGERPEEREPTN